MIMQPIVSIIIYCFVFQIGFKNNPVRNISYALWWLQNIYYLGCNIMLATGVFYLISAANVFVKDMGEAVNICMQFDF